MKNKKYTLIALSLALITGSALALPALAADYGSNQPATPKQGEDRGLGSFMQGKKGAKGVFGTVTAINGNNITLTGRQGFGTSTPTATYTVDASKAKVTKNNATSAVGNIVVGDTIMVQGTITGTNVVATIIRDGQLRGPNGDKGSRASSSPIITGNGQPVVAGVISTISGSTITITNKSNVTYTIDATNAKIAGRQNTPLTIANLKVGDSVVVQGSVNGNAITASAIIDQAGTISGRDNNGQPAKGGLFNGIGQFFSRLFGF